MKLDLTTVLLAIVVIAFCILAVFFIKNTNTDMGKCVQNPLQFGLKQIEEMQKDKITCTCSGSKTQLFYIKDTSIKETID